jgi:hypothetical protein
MLDIKNIMLITVYIVLAMILVSIEGTYKITYKLFGKMTKDTQTHYGTGMTFKEPGFWIHIFVFALLVMIPMLFKK